AQFRSTLPQPASTAGVRIRVPQAAWTLAPQWRRWRSAVLARASLVVLMGHAALARPLGYSGGYSSATVAAPAAALQAAQQQADAARRSQAAMSRAISALRSVQAMQAVAHAAALSTSVSVPDGLAPGGLVPATSAPTPYTQDPTGVKKWDGATLPSQSQ